MVGAFDLCIFVLTAAKEKCTKIMEHMEQFYGSSSGVFFSVPSNLWNNGSQHSLGGSAIPTNYGRYMGMGWYGMV